MIPKRLVVNCDLYCCRSEYEKCLGEEGVKAADLPADQYAFEVRFEIDVRQMYRNIQVGDDVTRR